MSADGWSPIAMHMLRNWKDIVVAARLSLCLALLSSLRSWQMFTLKTELRPVAGNHQVVYRHPECFYFCPLLWWENGWVWWNISSPPLRPVQPVGRTWQTRESVWNSYCRSLSVWPFLHPCLERLFVHPYLASICIQSVYFSVAGASVRANILGLTCYDNSEVKKCIDP